MDMEVRPHQTTAPAARIPGSAAPSPDDTTLSILFGQDAVGIMHVDADLRILRANRRMSDMLGRPTEELLGLTVTELTHPDDREISRQALSSLSRIRPTCHLEKRYLHGDGSPVWVSLAITALFGSDGQVRSYFGAMEDITQRKAQAVMLEDEKRVLEQIAGGAPLPTVLEELGKLWNRHARRFPRCALTLTSATGDRMWVAAAPGLPAAFSGLMWDAKAGGSLFTGTGDLVITDLAEEHEQHPEYALLRGLGVRACWRHRVLGRRGRVLGALLAFAPGPASPSADDTALMERIAHLTRIAISKAQTEQEMTQVTSLDRLTGLPNRSLLQDRLARALTAGARKQRRTALLLLNLDGMRGINESLGYAFGDEFIKAAARRLHDHTRRGDTLARFGGDEFGMVIEGAPDDAELRRQALDLLAAVTRPLEVDGEAMFVTASIGVGIAGAGERDADALFRHADAALHRAKGQGAGSLMFYSSEMDASSGRLALLGELRQALEQDRLEVHYQPKLDLHDRGIAGAEALMRWRHPERGLVPPAEFIPLLEESGLIIAAGERLLRRVCRDLVALAERGLTPPRVAINLSPRQFHRPELADDIAGILHETGARPEWLSVEITESLMMQEPEKAIHTLERLREMRLTVAVDDFGVGYSSLGYLKRFPVDVLKIDKSFVDGLGADAADGAIVDAITRMAHSLGMRVVAEGVETDAQHAILAKGGCDELQGYLYSEPLDIEAFAAFLR